VSGTEVDEKLYPGIGKILRAFEWLHRSAYSYGGLKSGGPDSSQTYQNLVFGTFEANTFMIRTEDYLKRLARRKEKVAVTTTLLRQKSWADQQKTLSWLVPSLNYAWEFNLDANTIVQGRRKFELTSQRIPTRVEVELDAEVEKEWYREDPVSEALHLLYLRSKHDLGNLL